LLMRPHLHFTHHIRKNSQKHPHFARSKIRTSADPHFTDGRDGSLVRRATSRPIFEGSLVRN